MNISKDQIPKFICITGIDGAGKTTLAKEFVRKMNEMGIKYKYSWVNSQPIFMYFLRFFWRLLLKAKKVEDYDTYKKEKSNLAEKGFIGNLYSIVHKIDYKLWVWYKVKLPLFFNKGIIVDRYYFDVAINYTLINESTEKEILNNIQNYQKWMPAPNVIFLLSVPVETAFLRKTDIPSIDYLKERVGIYNMLKKHFTMIELDGTKDTSLIVTRMVNCFNNL